MLPHNAITGTGGSNLHQNEQPPQGTEKAPPVHAKSDKMPYLPQWQAHRWIILYTSWPLALHQLYVFYFKQPLPPSLAGILYSFAYLGNALMAYFAMQTMGLMYGYLDGDKHTRDEFTSKEERQPISLKLVANLARPCMALWLTYRRDAPSSISWYFPLEAALYPIILDFFFYWYHRVMHEVEGLWQFHRRHHLTKHPNPKLAGYADTEQVISDVVLIPLATWITMRSIGLPMGFFEWWICNEYVTFTELLGHSGLRMYATPASPISPLLEYLNMELVIEDHDLHHRAGWKKASNYGKQTRIWDTLFGTRGARIETLPSTVDWSFPATMPIFGEFSAVV